MIKALYLGLLLIGGQILNRDSFNLSSFLIFLVAILFLCESNDFLAKKTLLTQFFHLGLTLKLFIKPFFITVSNFRRLKIGGPLQMSTLPMGKDSFALTQG